MTIESSLETPDIRQRSTYKVREPSVFARIRVQLGLGLFFACIMPMLMRIDIGLSEKVTTGSQYNTLIATACAVILGFSVVRRLNRYPGIASISYVMPSFAISYGIALSIIILFRVDYSRFFLFVSFINAQLWFHFIVFIADKISNLSFDVVPFGNARKLCEIPQIQWNVLESPKLNGQNTQGVAADLRTDLSDEWEAFLANSAVNGIPVYHFKQLSEDLTGKVEIEHLSENNLGSLLPSFFYLRFKQSIDIVGAILLLPLVLPLSALIAIGIKRDSTGPVFFSQPRIGYRGQVFLIWKFRTMRHNHSEGADERTASITDDGDPRVTQFGRFLRRTRLDELPQIINILRGEMSWIGPRPEAVALSRWYEKDIPFYRYRHIVRPGITGWAQVNQGHVAEVDDVHAKLHFDFYYIKNFSVWLDILITMRTIATMLTGFGAR